MKYYRMAAEQGDMQAQHSLGKMYELGHGVPKDMTEATKWIRKAADQGDADAKEWLEKNAKEKNE